MPGESRLRATGSRELLSGFAVAVLVGVLAVVSTPEGLLVAQGDSPAYLATAESLAAGDGYRLPYGDVEATVKQWPPGYPALLSIGVSLGFDSHDVARFAGILTVSLLGFSFFLYTRRRGLGILGSTLVALIAVVVSFRYVLAPGSELTYGLLLLATMALLRRYASVKSTPYIAAASLVAASAIAVRFIGIALVATVVISAFLAADRFRTRLIHAFSAVALGLVPLVLFSPGGRELLWHPPSLGDFKIMANAIAGWFVPPLGSPTQRFAVFSLAVLAGGLLWTIRTRRREKTRPSKRFRHRSPGIVSAGAHLLALFGALTFFDPAVRINVRLLYPVAISLLVAAVDWLGQREDSTWSETRTTRVLAIFGIAALIAGSWGAILDASVTRGGDLDYRSASFIESPVVLATVSATPESYVYSNVPDGLWVAGLDGARLTPRLIDAGLRANESLEPEIEEMASRVEEGLAVIFFYKAHERPYLVDEPELRIIAPCVIAEDDEAVLLAGLDHSLCFP